MLHPLLLGPRLRGRPQLQHQVPQFPLLRRYRLQSKDDGLEGRPFKVFYDRGRDRQQWTESQFEEAQHFREPDSVLFQSAEGTMR